MSTMQSEERIGEAWQQHRAGNNVKAIEIFQEILNRTPNNLDALYGMGLARRANKQADEAIKVFKQAQDLAQSALAAVETAAAVDGHVGTNDLSSYEDDRFLMLSRMIKQRLAELGA